MHWGKFALAGLSTTIVYLVASASGNAADNQPPGAVEVIVVTAEKRAQDVRDVPATVTAITADKLKAYRVTSIVDLPTLSPGLQVSQSAGMVQLNIRGINAGITQGTFESPVATSVNGFYIAHPYALVGAFLDVSRVEVIEGPQGTLYGRNATAGAVNIITNAPTDQFELLASAELSWITDNGAAGGAFGGKETVVANAPFDDGKVRVRLAVQKEDHGGYATRIDQFNNQFPLGDAHNINARLEVAVDLASDLTWTLEGDAFSANDHSTFQDTVGLNSPSDLVGVSVYGGRFSLPESRTLFTDKAGPTKPLIFGFSSTLGWTLSPSTTIRSLTGFRQAEQHSDIEFDGTTAPISSEVDNELSDQFSQEFQLLYDEAPLHVVGGVYYFHDRAKIDLDPVSLLLAPTIPPTFGYVRIEGINKTDAFAVYGDATYSVTEDLDLTVGARYSIESKGGAQNSVVSFVKGGPPLLSNIVPDLPTKNYYSFTPRAVIKYRPWTNVMLYASWSKGFKSGGYNTGDLAQNTPFSPEKISAYELGVKTSFWDDRLGLNASMFYYDYTDLQVSVNRSNTVIIANAASALVKGFELQGDALVTENLSLTGGLMLLDAHFLRGEMVDPLLGGPPQPLDRKST